MDTAPGWWSRNWKWVVPSGCLTVILIFAGGIALMVTLAFSLMKQSEVYTLAMAQARTDPAVIAALGAPVDDGYVVSGNISESGVSGEAQLAIPVSGPRASGTLYLEAKKSTGRWQLTALVLRTEGNGEAIDLLAPDDPK